jgi:small GTP-binding protein
MSCCGGGSSQQDSSNNNNSDKSNNNNKPSGILKNKQSVAKNQRSPKNNNEETTSNSPENQRKSGYSGDSILKFCICGQSSVGKTSLTKRLCFGVFNQNLRPTIGVDFLTKSLVIDGDCITLQLFDLQGQDVGGAKKSTTNFYYRGSHAIIIVTDAAQLISNTEKSVAEITNWKNDVDEKFSSEATDRLGGSKKSVPVVLFVNKVDLIETKKEMSQIEDLANNLVKELGFRSVHYVSAATGAMVQESFMEIVDTVR